MCNSSKKLIVVGDSHSIIWSGTLFTNLVEKTSSPRETSHKSIFENVEVFWLGPSLAYNLMGKGNELGKWGFKVFEKIDSLLNNNVKIGYIILSFGEIDIRCHVVKQALLLNCSIEKIVDNLTNKLIKFVEI